MFQLDASNRIVGNPIDMGAESDQVILVLFGTGIRGASLDSVSATVDGVPQQVLFAGAQGGFSGLDQVNLRLSRTLAGRGSVDVIVRTGGKIANTVTVQFK